MFIADASILLNIRPQWVWMHASKPDFLSVIPLVDSLELMGTNSSSFRIKALTDALCIVKPSLRELPRRITWHSVGGVLRLRVEITIEREGVGSRLKVQLQAAPKDPKTDTRSSLERAFSGLSEALKVNLERFALDLKPDAVHLRRALKTSA